MCGLGVVLRIDDWKMKKRAQSEVCGWWGSGRLVRDLKGWDPL